MTWSFSSPSSSSSTSFDANNSMYNSSSCLVGVLRRLLCSGTFPAHQPDHITDEPNSPHSHTSNSYSKHIEATDSRIACSPGPGVVARLMGLDSMPDFSSIHSQKSPNSILRSRSMNSADYDQLQAGREQEQLQQHRRVKTSVSFREMPTFVDQENDEYLVLSFENVGRKGIEESRTKQRRSEMGLSQMKQRSDRKFENKENRAPRVSENKKKRNQETEEEEEEEEDPNRRLKPINSNKISENEQSKRRRRRKKKKKTSSGGSRIQKLGPEAECSSEDSSPVSVLDFSQLFTTDPQFPSEEGPRSADSSSRRKLAPKLEKYEDPPPINDQKTKPKQRTCLEPRKQESESYKDMWGSICRLAETDMMMESNWSHRKSCSFEDLGDVYEDLEVQILHQLFHELVLES